MHENINFIPMTPSFIVFNVKVKVDKKACGGRTKDIHI